MSTIVFHDRGRPAGEFGGEEISSSGDNDGVVVLGELSGGRISPDSVENLEQGTGLVAQAGALVVTRTESEEIGVALANLLVGSDDIALDACDRL